MNEVATTDELFEMLVRRLPVPSPEEQRAGIILLRELARGALVSVPEFARALDTSVQKTEALIRTSALSPFVHVDKDDQILGFYGLSVVPTRHQTIMSKRKLWTWCAPDMLEHAELLDQTAEVESADPETGHMIRLTVSPTRIESVEPREVIVSIRRPEMWDMRSAAGLITSGCHFHFFFASRQSAERWLAKHPDSFLVPLGEVFAFIRRLNSHLFGSELARRRASTA